MNLITFKGKLSTLCASFILLALALVCLPTSSANAAVVYSTDGVENLRIDSPIVIEFDQMIQFDTNLITDPTTPNSAFDGIQLLDVTNETAQTPGVSVDIRLVIDRNVLKVIPEPALEIDKEYRLEVTKDIVLDKNTVDLTAPGEGDFVFGNTALSGDGEKYNFSTYSSLTFLELMEGGGEITDLIEYYTPRQMIVTAPIRYIEEMEVIHRQPGMEGDATTEVVETESVTNLDITIDDSAIHNVNGDVARMEVIVNDDVVAEKKRLNLFGNSGSSDYTFGFTGLPDNAAYDIRVIVYDNNDNILDNQIMKVSYKDGETTSTGKFKDKARTAGKSFTLYELLEKERDLQKLLDENPMEFLKVQVTEE